MGIDKSQKFVMNYCQKVRSYADNTPLADRGYISTVALVQYPCMASQM